MAGLLERILQATPLVGSASGLLGYATREESPSFRQMPAKPYRPGTYQPGQAYGTGQEGLLEQGLMKNFQPADFPTGRASLGFLEAPTKPKLDAPDLEAARREYQFISRNPLAAIGFDYRRFRTHTGSHRGPAFNVGGMVDVEPERKTYMQGYATLSNGIPHHEAVHAGLERLRAAGKLPREMSDAMKSYGEENVTKWLTYRMTGDKELNGDKFIRRFMDGQARTRLERAAEKTMKVAADMIAKSRPGGPR